MKQFLYSWRAFAASAAIAAAFLLNGCNTDGGGLNVAKALRPLSPQMVAAIEQKNMSKESPILARIFKEESELEIWKQDNTGRFALLKTYPICRWSGELGPKMKQGDRQAPEGFYTITPAQMNPNSAYYLSFNIGYPNAYDRSFGRTGSQLMVHGDCSSAGCYAMTDDQIGEIYALARDSFFGGQQAFQIQAYPFHMTALNMAKHRNSPHFAFWKNLKQGYDHFEVSRLEPKVNVCDRRYVFDAEAPNGGATAPRFDAAGRCPPYEVNSELLAAVVQKEKADDQQFAALVQKNTPTVPARTGRDGGMHETFLAKLQPHLVRDPDGTTRYDIDPVQAAKLGSYVNPPKDPDKPVADVAVANVPRTLSLASAESKPAPRPAQSESTSTLGRLSRWVGLTSDEPKQEAPKASPAPAPKGAAARPSAAAGIAAKPSSAQEANAEPPALRTTSAGGASLMSGATAPVPSDSFENRFGR